MKIVSLGSGSKGNSTLVEIAGKYVLIDDGFSLKETERRMPVTLGEVCAILLTHDHSDHLLGVGEVSRKYGIDVHIPDRLISLRNSYLKEVNCRTHTDGEWELEGLNVTQFRLPHDATYTVGYKIQKDNESFAIATDLGMARESIIENLKGVNTVFIESNYDCMMLEKGPYPIQLKNRIRGGLGHISNDQAGEVCKILAQSGAKRIVLSHISENNNIPELAYDTVGKKLAETDTKIVLNFAEQSKVKIF